MPRIAAVTASIADARKVDNSRKAIAVFLGKQTEWLERATDALRNGYIIETIGIAQHQIHAMLRRGLWLQAQLQSLEQHPDVWNDSYLFDLLQSRQDLMAGALDRELYNAAQRFGVIDDDTASALHGLIVHATSALRETFSHPRGTGIDLRAVAEQFLEADRACFGELQDKFARFERRIGTVLQSLQKQI